MGCRGQLIPTVFALNGLRLSEVTDADIKHSGLDLQFGTAYRGSVA